MQHLDIIGIVPGRMPVAVHGGVRRLLLHAVAHAALGEDTVRAEDEHEQRHGRVLAQHYGFTGEELDFIINYDIKYRMGDKLFEEGG